MNQVKVVQSSPISQNIKTTIDLSKLPKVDSFEGPDWEVKIFGKNCVGSEPTQEEFDELEEMIYATGRQMVGFLTNFCVTPVYNGTCIVTVHIAFSKSIYKGEMSFTSASDKDDSSRVTVPSIPWQSSKQGDQFIIRFDYKNKRYSILFYCNRKSGNTLKTTSWPRGLPKLGVGLTLKLNDVEVHKI